MNPQRKSWIAFASFFLVMAIIACSCPIIPTPTPGPNNLTEPIPGLSGQWQDPETKFVFTIVWNNSSYQVTSILSTNTGNTYPVASQSWDGSALTWSYTTTDNYTLSYETVSVSGDGLSTNWSANDGNSGTETLQRYGGTSQPNPSGNNSLEVTSAESGVVTSSATGVSVTIPSGAVPLKDDGSAGSMIFSIQEDTTTTPSLPGGYVAVGPVVNLGPEGFVFEQPVTISIPISSGTDPANVMGASYYDTGTGVWILVPGTVDATTRTVEVSTTHFSLWTAWGFGPAMPEDNVNYGVFRIYRPSAGMGYAGPEHNYSGATTSHGICIRSASLDDPSRAERWDSPFSVSNYWGGITSDDREPYGTYRMPTGSYQLTEYIAQSEINPGDPMYIPKFYQVWRDLGTVSVAGGQTIEFAMPNWAYNEGEWTAGRPPCWGTVTTSVGVGDLQVTLNWNAEADLDLHVIEPGGEEIWFQNLQSSSGGALDRDNQCADFTLGRPENTFWPDPPDGTYQVSVVYYADCGGAGAVNFNVRICKQSNCSSPINGQATSEGGSYPVTTFTYP